MFYYRGPFVIKSSLSGKREMGVEFRGKEEKQTTKRKEGREGNRGM
jgi:hypothetical protein